MNSIVHYDSELCKGNLLYDTIDVRNMKPSIYTNSAISYNNNLVLSGWLFKLLYIVLTICFLTG